MVLYIIQILCKPKAMKHCIECSKEIVKPLKQRCQACYARLRRKDPKVMLANYASFFKVGHKYRCAVNGAKARGMEFLVSKEEYKAAIDKGCYYCGANTWGFTGASLDRMDTTQGYTIDNVVACCPDCNMNKGTRFTAQEWKAAMQAIKNFRS